MLNCTSTDNEVMVWHRPSTTMGRMLGKGIAATFAAVMLMVLPAAATTIDFDGLAHGDVVTTPFPGRDVFFGRFAAAGGPSGLCAQGWRRCEHGR